MMYNKDVKHHYRALKICSNEDQMDNKVAFAGFGFKGRCKKDTVFSNKVAQFPEKKKGNHANNKNKNENKCFYYGNEVHCAVDGWYK